MTSRSFIISSSLVLTGLVIWLALKLMLSHQFLADNHGVAAFKKNPTKILIVGTSHADTGFSTEYFSKQGIDSFVLSFPQMNPIELALLLKHHFQSFPDETKLIVVDLFPPHFATLPELKFLDLFYALPFEGKWDLMKIMWNEYAKSGSAGYWYKLIIRGYNEDFLQMMWAPQLMDQAYYKGAKKTHRQGMSLVNFTSLKNKQVYYDKMVGLHQSHLKGLNKVMDHLEPYKKRVVFLSTPFTSHMDKARGLSDIKMKISSAVTSRGFPFIDSTAGFDRNAEHELYYDEHHFSEKGRLRHTQHFLNFPEVKDILLKNL